MCRGYVHRLVRTSARYGSRMSIFRGGGIKNRVSWKVKESPRGDVIHRSRSKVLPGSLSSDILSCCRYLLVAVFLPFFVSFTALLIPARLRSLPVLTLFTRSASYAVLRQVILPGRTSPMEDFSWNNLGNFRKWRVKERNKSYRLRLKDHRG